MSAAMAMAMAMSGCAGARARVRADNQRMAALDPELVGLPGARAFWSSDPEYGGQIYVVVVEPAGGAAAPTLVLVHGLGTAGLRDYYPVLGQLARGRRVVAFDLPGFGHSTAGNQRYTPARYAAVLSSIIGQYGGGRGAVDVMGHSMGGAIALLHAGTYPQEVRRLIIVDAAGILHREAWFGHHLHRVTGPGGLYFPETAQSLNDLAGSAMDLARSLDPAPEIVLGTTWLRQKLLGGEPGRIAALSLILTDFGDPLSRIVAPTLLVWGAADAVAPLRTGLLLADRLYDATLSVLPGVGHNVMAEAPAPLFAAVQRYLTAPAPPTAAAPPAGSSLGDVHCQGQADLQLRGTYGEVTLEHCARATIEGAAIGRLVLRSSSAHLIRSTVASGVVAESSQLMITGGRLQGETALDLTDSAVDLAGVLIGASGQPYRLAGKSKALFSVCSVMTPSGLRHWHGLLDDASGGVAGAAGGSFDTGPRRF